MAHYPLLYFNSIKVQLKRGMEQAGYNTALFQFHKGTIKTTAGIEQYLRSIISIP